jgi:hypothetical protein
MDTRSKRFLKEKSTFLVPICENETFENMRIAPHVSITLHPHYPFKPPILWINDLVYTSYFIQQFSKYDTFVNKHHIKILDCCICCDSITHDTIWSPCYNINSVLEDYKKFYHLLKNIIRIKYTFDILPFDDLINTTILSYLVQIEK